MFRKNGCAPCGESAASTSTNILRVCIGASVFAGVSCRADRVVRPYANYSPFIIHYRHSGRGKPFPCVTTKRVTAQKPYVLIPSVSFADSVSLRLGHAAASLPWSPREALGMQNPRPLRLQGWGSCITPRLLSRAYFCCTPRRCGGSALCRWRTWSRRDDPEARRG